VSEAVIEEQNAPVTEQEVPALGMSDEDFLKMPAPDNAAATIEEEKTGATDAEVPSEAKATEAAGDTGSADEKGGDQSTELLADPKQSVEKPAVEGEVGEKPPVTDKEIKPEVETPPKTEGVVDYKAEYDRLLAPFKANGRDIAVKSVDDAITLMQMGANYNKKMAALKPHMKMLKLLENNGLLDEAKLSFLVDLDKKNPAAISKLVQDSGLNSMELDADKASTYKQTTYTVDDKEIELDTVLDELKDSPTYNRTLDVVGNKWDAASKNMIATTPAILRVINNHMASGIYDIINQEMESERVFGRLNGLSDIEAYRQIGDAIQARGGFNHLVQGSKPTTAPVTAPVIKPAPATKQPSAEETARLNDKRRAAGSTKPAAPTSIPKDFNPLALSDEEFSKQINQKFL
jgi:hypothetical protein